MPRKGKSSAPSKPRDLVLSHMTHAMFERLQNMYQRSSPGIDFYIWVAQKVECDIVIPFFNASQTPGVNASEQQGKP